MLDVNLGDWDTETSNIELNTNSKTLNCKYYLVLRINKKNFFKDLEHLVKIGVLTPVQYYQYGTTVFIIPNK